MEDPKIYYIYVHLRSDSGLPYYLGKGSGNRCYEFQGRNIYWRRVQERHGCTVELLHTGLTEKEAFAKEIQEIAWFRRYYDMTNISDGGEGPTRSAQTDLNKANIRQFFETFGRFPSRSIPEEECLATAHMSYCAPSQICYDPEFRAWAESCGYGDGSTGVGRDSNDKKQKIRDFYLCNGRFPGTSAEEKPMRIWLGNYTGRTQHAYDPEFHSWCCERGYGAENRAEGKAEKRRAISEFFDRVGRLPSYREPEEKSLYVPMKSYCASNHNAFDPEFRKWCEERGYGKRNKKKEA